MNTAHDETRMPSGQGFNRMGSNGDDIECVSHTRSHPRLSVKTDIFCLASVHVHVQVSRQGDSTMVSLDTPSSPDNPMGAAGARHNSESPSGMRTTYQSMNQVQGFEHCLQMCFIFAPDKCPANYVSRCHNPYSSPWVESITREGS